MLLLALLLVAAAAALLRWRRTAARPPRFGGLDGAATRQLVERLTALEAREKEVAETVWAKELLAEQCGRVLEQFWDSLNRAPDKLAVAGSLPFEELRLPSFGPTQALGHGILLREAGGSTLSWTPSDWQHWLAELQRAGWRLEQTEFRHNRFDLDASGKPGQSQFYFSAHLRNLSLVERATLAGDLIVDWSSEQAVDGLPAVRRVDASRVTLLTRRGEPPFRQVLMERVTPPEKSFFIDPLIVYDLDGDGLSEIILAAKNLVFRSHGGWEFKSEPLCRHSPGLIFTAVMADFDGDGGTDFLCAGFEGLTLFKGSPQGTFDEPGRRVWSAEPHLKYGQVLTCGDVDADGDLDVWLGQYKNPYERGQMPTPYYDANDGNPSCLLLNDGHGNFVDGTSAAGLGAKRWRRTYSSSLVDLDDDGDLDLFVVSDFAGIDVYLNDGRGHFAEVTRSWVPEARGFGMAHAFADFDADGRTDVFVTGMHCPTALRLAHMGLVRPEQPDYAAMIPSMTSGNRLLLMQAKGGFTRTALNDSVAHSGWSWGCSAFDFDNDGFPDLYIANGHESRATVRDYDPEFWLHDIYVGNSSDNLVASAYFQGKSASTRGQGDSYGGYEKNRLFWNRQGARFIEVGYLFGVGLEQDSRNVVAEDLDGDGRVDLLVTTFEVWPEAVQTLRIFRNELGDSAHWVGVRSRDEAGRGLPPGTKVTLRHPHGLSVQQQITGDSHRVQRSGLIHFGLGTAGHADRLEIMLPNRHAPIRLPVPTIDRYGHVSLLETNQAAATGER
jgi:enediyne biosynthesis protein E4